ncbi:factor-independent urate hydroxylase [Aeoliella sp. SH292]|uniref:factor-independent urate hydroxylase n=1 Tax=Aeoliella sp. SH292 TaxID=3454464 RepID=UPI003F944B43
MAGRLASHRYGKHRVRVSKVRRPRLAPANEERHEFVEVSVDIELEGAFAPSYTDGDNHLVVATDTCKNTVYVLAKDDPMHSIEAFGLVLANDFLSRYSHVSQCKVRLSERVWDRLGESPHSFVAKQRMVPQAIVRGSRGEAPIVMSGFKKLLVAKTTESGFENFHQSEFRTLPDTHDRILATEMSTNWRYSTLEVDFAETRQRILDSLVRRFTDHYSRSVQETLYFMGQAALAAEPAISEITLTLPNKHHLLANLAPFGRENQNEVFVVTDEPFGFITATVVR